MRKKGFTLLELIIIIVIIGVLAGLALPRLFSVIEFSRSAEAISFLATYRAAMERYYLMNGTYAGSGGSVDVTMWEVLGIDDFANAPNVHFQEGGGGWGPGFVKLRQGKQRPHLRKIDKPNPNA